MLRIDSGSVSAQQSSQFRYTSLVKNLGNLSVLILVGACATLSSNSSAQTRSTSASSAALLVANQEDHDVSFIDPARDTQTATVPDSGYTGHELAVYPAGHIAFVPIYGNSGVGKPGTDGQVIDIVDVRTEKAVNKIDFGHGVRPHCAVYEPVSGMMYVTTELDKTVSIINPKTLKIVGAIPTGQEQSHMLAISSDGRRGYTANVGPGTVSVLDLKGRKTITVIKISGETQRISISKDNKWVFTADQTKPQMAVIDTATNAVKSWIPLPALGYGTASTKDGKSLLVTMPSLDQVAVVDLATMKVTSTIGVGKHPTEILVRPDGAAAYVSSSDGKVTVVDPKQSRVLATMDAGKGADGLAWAQ